MQQCGLKNCGAGRYDNAAKIAKTALAEGKTLKEVAVELDYLAPEDFDKSAQVSAWTVRTCAGFRLKM